MVKQKKHYPLYSVSICISEYDISLIKNIICNFVGDLFKITDDLIMSVIKQKQ